MRLHSRRRPDIRRPARVAVCRSNLLAGMLALSATLVLAPSVLAAQDAPAQRSAGPIASALPLDRIAAVVGTTVILVSDIEAALVAQQIEPPADSAERMELQRSVLNQLIDIEVLVQRASKDTTLILDEAEINSMADAQVSRVRTNFPGDAEFRAALVEAGFGTPDEYRTRQYEELRKRSMQETYLATLKQMGKFVTVNVSERDVTAELEKMGDKLPDRPASVGFQQIVIPTLPGDESKAKSRALIDSLFKLLNDNPTRFEELAKEFSQDGSSAQGGDLGWNRRGVMVPEFDRVMFMLNPGVVSPPVESRYGWHLIRVDRVQPAEVKARHILIKASTDSADGARAQQLADSVRAMWDRGVAFDSLRQQYHDERSGEDAIIPEVGTADLPAPYAEAIGDAQQGDLVGPFAIDDQATGTRKWVVLSLTRVQPAGTMTLDEARRNLRRNMQEAYSLRRLLDGLRDQTYVSIRF